MHLVFFEIKPLQKNKKLIHLFIYKSISHLEKNQLTFYSRKELMKNGFLQLAIYLHQHKIKHYKFKSQKGHSIATLHSDFYKKKLSS